MTKLALDRPRPACYRELMMTEETRERLFVAGALLNLLMILAGGLGLVYEVWKEALVRILPPLA